MLKLSMFISMLVLSSNALAGNWLMQPKCTMGALAAAVSHKGTGTMTPVDVNILATCKTINTQKTMCWSKCKTVYTPRWSPDADKNYSGVSEVSDEDRDAYKKLLDVNRIGSSWK